MKVFLLRHATRNFTLGDVPLNDEGIIQAQQLALNTKLSSVSTIACSPKLRAQMTVRPLADYLNIEIQTLSELDQFKNSETQIDFTNRVRLFLEKIEQGSFQSPLLVCSHSDWLSLAAQLIPSDQAALEHHIFSCAEFLSFDLKDGLWQEL